MRLAKWKWEWGCRGSSPTRLKTARSAQEASATRPLHAAAAGRPFSNLSFPRGVIAKFDVGQEGHVSKTGLILAFRPGVNGFASLRDLISGFVVDGRFVVDGPICLFGTAVQVHGSTVYFTQKYFIATFFKHLRGRQKFQHFD